MIHFSLVVPCYNDAGRLRRGVERLRDTMAASGLSWEFVFVEDHSRDNTAGELRSCVEWLESQGVAVSAIYHNNNHGHGGAVSSGIRTARGDVVGYLDLEAGLTEALVPMIEQVRLGDADLVVGRRCFRNPIAVPLRFAAYLVYRIYVSTSLALPVADPECRLKVFLRSQILPLLETVVDQHCFWDTELVHRAWRDGLKIAERPVKFAGDSRAKGGPLLHAFRAYRRAMRNYRRICKLPSGVVE